MPEVSIKSQNQWKTPLQICLHTYYIGIWVQILISSKTLHDLITLMLDTLLGAIFVFRLMASSKSFEAKIFLKTLITSEENVVLLLKCLF